jgi:hypothetical protein
MSDRCHPALRKAGRGRSSLPAVGDTSVAAKVPVDERPVKTTWVELACGEEQ